MIAVHNQLEEILNGDVSDFVRILVDRSELHMIQFAQMGVIASDDGDILGYGLPAGKQGAAQMNRCVVIEAKNGGNAFQLLDEYIHFAFGKEILECIVFEPENPLQIRG